MIFTQKYHVNFKLYSRKSVMLISHNIHTKVACEILLNKLFKRKSHIIIMLFASYSFSLFIDLFVSTFPFFPFFL